ncbi:MAG: 3-oxoacyl-ACP reductase FabG [Candidatus Omnitrophota bacterium]
MKAFKGKVALVSGGSRGIGRAICLMLANEGADVAFSYLTNKEKADELVRQIEQKGVRCLASKVDVRDFEAVKSWVSGVREKFGGLDFLVNNAGIVRDKPLMMMLEEDWHDIIGTNLDGMFNVVRASIVTFLKQRRGNIVNISSVSGLIGLSGQTNYSAAKGGMNSFTKALAKETAAYGIRVNAVAPGFIETDMLSSMDAQQQEKIKTMIPFARFGSADEVAAVVRFLLSEESSYIIGQVIQMDGGLAIR